MSTKKKIVISWRNHGRDFKYYIDYVIDTQNFEQDMEVLRVLENSYEDAYLEDDAKAFSKRHIVRNVPVVVVKRWLEYCNGEKSVDWRNFEKVMENVLKLNDVLPNGNYDHAGSCYQYHRLQEGLDLYKKLDTEEMFNYWRSISRRCDNSSAGTTGDVYHITFSMIPAEDFHCWFDMPSNEMIIGEEIRNFRKRNRAQAFDKRRDFEGAI